MRDRHGIAGIVASTAIVLGGCGSLLGLHVHAILGLLVAGGLTVLALVATWVSIRHVRLARRLHAASSCAEGPSNQVYDVPGLAPVVAGLVRPRLYAGVDLLAALPRRQRDAVIAHERSHRDHRDPLRLVGLESIRRCLGWIPVVATVEQANRARLEIRADRDALDDGATRQDLAAALLRLSSRPPTTMAAFGEVTDLRLQALLGDDVRSAGMHSRPSWLRLVPVMIATAVATAACTWLLASPHVGLL